MTFGPPEMTVNAGEPVSWSLYLCHTISFNPPAEAFGDLRREADGSVRLNPLAYAAAQAPAPPAITFDPNAPPIRFDAGTWDGSGFFSSGGMCSLGTEDLTYTLRFSEPGEYQLRCLFHPFMRGTIKVA
jgi:plastocyanin